MKRRIFEIIQIGNKKDIPSRSFDIFISVTIILNISSMFLETFDDLSKMHTFFKVIETVTVLIFMAEYLLRIITADCLYPKCSRGKAMIRFIFSFDGIVDLLTILPFFFLSGFIVFRMLRVVRIFHLFRLNAQYDSFSIITYVLLEKKRQLLSSIFIIVILMLASSLGMYNAEHRTQPDVFKNAFSGIWWSVSTLLTVGYGDIYPVTIVGRIMAIITAFLGVGAVAIPTGIISAGFVEHYTKKSNSQRRYNDINEIGEILVGKSSKFKGMTTNDIKNEFDLEILLLLRDDLTIVPSTETKAKVGDVLVVRSHKLVKAKST